MSDAKQQYVHIGDTKEIRTTDTMMTLEMKIEVEEPRLKAFAMLGSQYKQIGCFTFHFADFFGNYRIAAILERFYHTEFVDATNERLIKITCQPLFDPSNKE